ncbi:hypothetical protein [Acidithiobacillus sulfuriphilus]|uniref:Uncharacterized protein n=2 Tax=Acidithiobacillus sulfuriphilus TaxID=1867749 RepID=A0A3M8R721_9PROT|nr:hypothetical protein [Acidithiobacillus sulfuriphilus]RNF64388.1 hypothetical protein EC580_05630 [Acidithiobacillus sulfuriphilus]
MADLTPYLQDLKNAAIAVGWYEIKGGTLVKQQAADRLARMEALLREKGAREEQLAPVRENGLLLGRYRREAALELADAVACLMTEPSPHAQRRVKLAELHAQQAGLSQKQIAAAKQEGIAMLAAADYQDG